MCADPSFSALLEAWTTKSDPHLTTVGIAYMLRGDKGASNTDPFAMAPTATNNWIVSPPHIMIAVPESSTTRRVPDRSALGRTMGHVEGNAVRAPDGSHGCDGESR